MLWPKCQWSPSFTTKIKQRLSLAGIVHLSNIFKRNREINVVSVCCLVSCEPLQHYFWSTNAHKRCNGGLGLSDSPPPCKPAELQERIEGRKLSWRLCTDCKASSTPADHTFPLLETGTKLALEETRAILCCCLINLYQSWKFQIWVRWMIQCMASGLSGHD